MCLLRYWMPELPLLRRNVKRSSKSPRVPPFHIRKVLPLVGFSLVVSPRTTPSLNDQRFVLPSQPSRSLVNSGFMPSGSGGAVGLTGSAATAPDRVAARSANVQISVRIMGASNDEIGFPL